MLIRVVAFIATSAAAVLWAYELGQRGAKLYERHLLTQAEAGLVALGDDWAWVTADGSILEVQGHAPDPEAKALALATVRAASPAAHVVDLVSSTPLAPEQRAPARIELHRDRNGITIAGLVADKEMSARMRSAIGSASPSIPVRDTTLKGARMADLSVEMAAASKALAQLPTAYVQIEQGSLQVEGQLEDRTARAPLIDALRTMTGSTVKLSTSIRAPQDVIAPFRFRATKRAGGVLELEECAARSEDERRAMLESLRALEVTAHADACPSGAGGPGGDWPGAMVAVLEALTQIPSGDVELSYRTVRISAGPEVLPAALARTADYLRSRLPDGYSADVTELLGGTSDETSASRPPKMRIVAQTDSLTMTGAGETNVSEVMLLAYASAVFPTIEVTAQIEPREPGTTLSGWDRAAMSVLDALSGSSDGDALMSGPSIRLRANLPSANAAAQVLSSLSTSPKGYDVTSELAIDLPRTLDQIRLPGQRCAERLNEIYAGTPIEFETASAEITAASAKLIDSLAASFVRCDEGAIEIGGHTDSSGRDDFNRRLSQSRANAVLAALMERGVPRTRMIARGYGKSLPIADNATPEGRARNRRIEFRSIERTQIVGEFD